MHPYLRTASLFALLALAACGKKPETSPVAPSSPVVAAATPVPTPAPTPEPPKANPEAQVVALCYHRVEGPAGGMLSMTPEQFEQEMQALKDQGIAVISMEDFLAWKRGEKPIPPRSVLITIDDGYLSGYTVAWPILKKFGYPFTMYVYTQYVNSGGKSVTWKQLEEMRDAGVDIGSHTISHQRLTDTKGKPDYKAWLHNELAGSKKILEDKLGIRVLTLAFPYGIHNEDVRKAGMEAGYEALFTVYGQKIRIDTPNDQIGRYAFDAKNSPDIFKTAVAFDASGSAPVSTGPVVAQLAAASMITQPMDGETVNTATPTIKANLATFGEIDPATVVMRIGGVGPVPAKYDPATKNVEYTFTQPLRNSECTVIVSAKLAKAEKKLETRWSFKIVPQ